MKKPNLKCPKCGKKYYIEKTSNNIEEMFNSYFKLKKEILNCNCKNNPTESD